MCVGLAGIGKNCELHNMMQRGGQVALAQVRRGLGLRGWIRR